MKILSRNWQAVWYEKEEKPKKLKMPEQATALHLDDRQQAVRQLLFAHPACTDSLADRLDLDKGWQEHAVSENKAADSIVLDNGEQKICELLARYGATSKAMANSLGIQLLHLRLPA